MVQTNLDMCTHPHPVIMWPPSKHIHRCHGASMSCSPKVGTTNKKEDTFGRYKHCGKRIKCWLPPFLSFLIKFSEEILSGSLKTGLLGRGLKNK